MQNEGKRDRRKHQATFLAVVRKKKIGPTVPEAIKNRTVVPALFLKRSATTQLSLGKKMASVETVGNPGNVCQ